MVREHLGGPGVCSPGVSLMPFPAFWSGFFVNIRNINDNIN